MILILKKMLLWELGETCEESDDNLKYEQLKRNFDDLHRNYQTLCKISLHRNKKSDDMEDVGYNERHLLLLSHFWCVVNHKIRKIKFKNLVVAHS